MGMVQIGMVERWAWCWMVEMGGREDGGGDGCGGDGHGGEDGAEMVVGIDGDGRR